MLDYSRKAYEKFQALVEIKLTSGLKTDSSYLFLSEENVINNKDNNCPLILKYWDYYDLVFKEVDVTGSSPRFPLLYHSILRSKKKRPFRN